MSLTREEQLATKRELREAMSLVGLEVVEVAAGLAVSEEAIKQTLDLCGRVIENPWILKEYLADQARKQGLTPVTFSASRRDYHDYWFLDAVAIDERKMS